MVPLTNLSKFWHFMYRASPSTYLMSGIMSTAVGRSEVICSSSELLHVSPPGGISCGEFLESFVAASGGTVLNPSATDSCSYCPFTTTDQYLAQYEISYDNRWRDFGLIWVYVVFNVLAALALYWVFRVPKGKSIKRV